MKIVNWLRRLANFTYPARTSALILARTVCAFLCSNLFIPMQTVFFRVNRHLQRYDSALIATQQR
ncbi:hypothetical protein [Providencia huashanensis]|uniref:hypothetical protein n=1 Tax=Providencia huashanensis TaxID=3037798 RepID=UPI003D2871C2